MEGFTQVKADVPRELKRRVFAAFALREEKFNRWLRAQMETWLQEVEGQDETGDRTSPGPRYGVWTGLEAQVRKRMPGE